VPSSNMTMETYQMRSRLGLPTVAPNAGESLPGRFDLRVGAAA
jgi:hypothetical protein